MADLDDGLRVGIGEPKDGWTAHARSTNSRIASQAASWSRGGSVSPVGRPSGGTGKSCSPETWRTARLVTRSFRPGHAASNPTGRSRVQQVLEVVQQDQQAPLPQGVVQQSEDWPTGGLAESERPGDG